MANQTEISLIINETPEQSSTFMLNQGPYLAERQESLKMPEKIRILNEFDPKTTKHVDRITNPKGGEVYLFYTTSINLESKYIFKYL